MRFVKMHGLGNDFVIVNALEKHNLPEGQNQLAKLAQRICHRNFGVGADGLILLWPSQRSDVRMQIINSDGSEAEMCGNGIRCIAKYLYEHNIVSREEVRVETLAGSMVPRLVIKNGMVDAVCVDMGEPRLEREEIPMLGPSGQVVDEPLEIDGATYRVTAVSMGNPHCLTYVNDVDAVPLHELGPKLETHPVFPRKTNVEFIQVLNEKEVRMRVWERGAGPTMACGTGACATVVGSALNGFTGRDVTVHLYAGSLQIQWAQDNHVYMTGPAEEIFSGEFPL